MAETQRSVDTGAEKDTVDGALVEVVEQRRREALVEWLATDPLPDSVTPT